LKGLQQLQQLASLSFQHVDLAAGWAVASGLLQLTWLQQLGIEDGTINLAVLQSIRWLKHLRLGNAKVVQEPLQCGLFTWISQQHGFTRLEVVNVFEPARGLQTGGTPSLGSHMHDLRLHL
jgi:hypothetical protein